MGIDHVEFQRIISKDDDLHQMYLDANYISSVCRNITRANNSFCNESPKVYLAARRIGLTNSEIASLLKVGKGRLLIWANEHESFANVYVHDEKIKNLNDNRVKYTGDKACREYYNLTRQGLSGRKIANALGIEPCTMYAWLDKYPEFKKAGLQAMIDNCHDQINQLQ